jgi:hypothetical protein
VRSIQTSLGNTYGHQAITLPCPESVCFDGLKAWKEGAGSS